MPNEVDAWLDRYDNPQQELLAAVRNVVLSADKRIGENRHSSTGELPRIVAAPHWRAVRA